MQKESQKYVKTQAMLNNVHTHRGLDPLLKVLLNVI